MPAVFTNRVEDIRLQGLAERQRPTPRALKAPTLDHACT